MPVRYTAHGGAMFNISEGLSITPNLLSCGRAILCEKMVGAYGKAVSAEEADFSAGRQLPVQRRYGALCRCIL